MNSLISALQETFTARWSRDTSYAQMKEQLGVEVALRVALQGILGPVLHGLADIYNTFSLRGI